MKFYRWLMRLLASSCEKQRMEFRHELLRVEAHAEDLIRTAKKCST